MLEVREIGGALSEGGGARRALMSGSDVTSAVSRQDAAMCHTGEGLGGGDLKRFVCQHESCLCACVHGAPRREQNTLMTLWLFGILLPRLLAKTYLNLKQRCKL